MNLLKKGTFSIVAVILSLTFSCGKKAVPTGEVNYVSGSNGTVTMRAIGSGSNQQEAITDAEKRQSMYCFSEGFPNQNKNQL